MYSKLKGSGGNRLSQIDGLDVIDGRVIGKVPIEAFKKIRKASIHNMDSDSLTHGKYTPTMENGVPNWGKAGPDSYIGRAGKESTYFDLGNDWNKIKKQYKLSDDDMFELFNIPVLDDAVKSGKEIRFSHDPRLRKYEETFLRQEWNYLKEIHGFKLLQKKGDVWIGK